MRRILSVTLVLGALGGSASQLVAQAADSNGTSTAPLFTGADAAVAGAFALTEVLMFPLDKRIANSLQDSTPQSIRFFRHTATTFRLVGDPGSLIIGVTMYGAGRVFKNDRMAELGAHGTEAIVVAMGVGGLIKGFAGRQRPFVDVNAPHEFKLLRGFPGPDKYRSFPSGHTLMGFAAAAAVTEETRYWWPNSTWYIAPVMYSGATIIGVSRIYNNMHWASDVVLGAAIGTFSGLKVVQYQHSHPKNRLDKWLLGASLSPGVDGRAAFHWSIMPR